MEVVKIPRFTLWNEESVVFEQIQRFAWMSSKLYTTRSETDRQTPSVYVLRKLAETTQLGVEELQVLFRLLKEVAFNYKEPENIQSYPRWCREPIITDDLCAKWSKQKRQLKRAIKEHENVYEQLRIKHTNCLDISKKVKKYKTLLDITTDLEDGDADTEDVSDNKFTVVAIQNHLEKRLSSHNKSVRLYDNILHQEQEVRRNVLDLAESLETDIRQRMRDKIELGLAYLKQVSSFDSNVVVDDVAKNLYGVICRKYSFYIPQEDINCETFRLPLPIPWHMGSEFVLPDYDFTYGYGKLGIVIAESKVEGKNYLKLNLEDIVKQKLVSADGSIGFGWTRPSKFSLKKWGFYPEDSLLFAK